MINCDLCSTEIAHQGFLCTTTQVVRSPKFWQHTFTIYNLNRSQPGLIKRMELVKSFMSNEFPWALCPTCGVKSELVTEEAVTWFEEFRKNSSFAPPQSGDARKFLAEGESKVIALHAATVEIDA